MASDDPPLTHRAGDAEIRAQVASLKEQRALDLRRIEELELRLQQAVEGHRAVMVASEAAQRPLLRRMFEAEADVKALKKENSALKARVAELEARLGERI